MLKKLFIYISGDIIVKGLAFLTLPFYSHLITPQEYGTIGLLSAIVAFLPVTLTLSYINGFVRFFFETNIKTILSTFMYLGLFLNILYIILSIILYQFFIYTFEIDFFYFILAISASALVFIFHILLVYYRSITAATSYRNVTIFYGLSSLSLNISLLLILDDNILAMLLASLINAIIVSSLALYLLKTEIAWKDVSWSLSKNVLRFTAPLTLAALGLLIFSQMDKLVLSKYITKAEMGVYVMAFSIALAVSYLGNAFFMSYQPFFFKQAEKQSDDIVKNYGKVIVFIVSAMLITFFAIGVIYQLINIKYMHGIKVALIITMAYSFLIFAQIMELHLSYVKKTSIVSIVYGLGGIISFISLLWFVPEYGMIGAAYALFIGGAIMSILMYNLAQKYFFLPYNKVTLFSFYIIMISCFIVVNKWIH